MTLLPKPKVTIVFTGGTISMRFDPAAGGAVPVMSGKEIIAQVPGAYEIADLRIIDFARLPGPHMTPAGMFELAQRVSLQLADDQVKGVVVTHGTDTLEETAYMLDLVLNSSKPVVFVGAMRNSSELGWDGPANLRAAIRLAADPIARDLGVMVALNDTILSAADATKTHTEMMGTFQGRDFGAIGLIEKDRIIVGVRTQRSEPIRASRLEERVEIVKLSAGSDGRVMDWFLQDGVKGLVVEGLGRGNVPVTAIPAVERAIGSGIPVVITSRCWRGRILDTYAYEGSGKHLKRLGAILGGMVGSHKARIKLMLLLGAGADLSTIRESFQGG